MSSWPRMYAIRFANGDYARTKSGKVRRFETGWAADRARNRECAEDRRLAYGWEYIVRWRTAQIDELPKPAAVAP